jgi:probable rRNA maturation factor
MFQITVQRAAIDNSTPRVAQLKQWAKAVLQNKTSSAELTIRIVGKDEMTMLNSTYRQKHKPTNVLSFPFEMPLGVEIDMPILGDIVICAEVIQEEAIAQHKAVEAHWAHMVVHGTLHLLGFDHEKDDEAEIMETEEVAILKKLGFSNPYDPS